MPPSGRISRTVQGFPVGGEEVRALPVRQFSEDPLRVQRILVNPRWITRSDWDMERRIVATRRTERLFDLYKIYVLAGRPGSAEAS